MAQRENLSGKWFNAEQYGVVQETGQIDFDQLRDQAKACQPKIILAGGSAYPRELNFAAFREIADEVGAYAAVDMAHISGLVAAGAAQICPARAYCYIDYAQDASCRSWRYHPVE